MRYDLQVVNGKDLTQFYNDSETEQESLMNFLKLSVKHWSHNDKVYKIVRYNKEYLSEDLIKSSGLFRSVIFKGNKIVSFSPPKSMNPTSFIDAYEDQVAFCSAEQYVEGTMINMFYDQDAWEIATRSTVGGKITFFRVDGNDTTFRQMFLDVCNYVNLDFDYLDKSVCYSFVLQHPENRIVTPIVEKTLYLVKTYKIEGYTVTEVNVREQLKLLVDRCIDSNATNVPVIKLPTQYKFTSFNELVEKYASMNTPYEDVGVMVYAPNGDRTKFRNPNYEDIRKLRGNQPKLQYHYLSLRKIGKIDQYLKYFPEHSTHFLQFREQLHRFTNNLHKNYVSCYVMKKSPLKDYPKQYRSIMYNLHQYYLNELREKRKCISKSVVIQFVNDLHPSQQMFLLNYNMRKQAIDIDIGKCEE